MKSLEARFRDIETKHPDWSTFVVFIQAIYEQGFSERIIRTWFNKLVDKDDYNQREKNQLMEWVVKQSKKGSVNG